MNLFKRFEVLEDPRDIRGKKYKLIDIVKDIPAEDLKKFIVSKKFDKYYVFDTSEFESQFCNYFPKQEYNYYYNKLYNQLILNKDTDFIVRDYLKSVEKYISAKDYSSAFDIIKAIINSYSENDMLDDIVDYLPKIGMFLRVIFRKSTKVVKDNINTLIKDLEKVDYYNNVYLEDIILTIK